MKNIELASEMESIATCMAEALATTKEWFRIKRILYRYNGETDKERLESQRMEIYQCGNDFRTNELLTVVDISGCDGFEAMQKILEELKVIM